MPLTVVMAHAAFSPERREMLPGVLASWQGGVSCVVEDRHRSGAWFTVRAALEEAIERAAGVGHVLVAQDDMRLARGGHALMAGLCDRYPGRVFSFRWPQVMEPWAGPWVEKEDECYLLTGHAWSGGCVAVPVGLAEQFLAWTVKFERVLRAVPHHTTTFCEKILRARDDMRLDMFLMSREIPVWRLRWSLLEHLGDVSVVRGGPRPPSPEVNLVGDVAGLPALDDPRWDGVDAPSCLSVPIEYRSAIRQLFGGKAGELGLAEAASW